MAGFPLSLDRIVFGFFFRSIGEWYAFPILRREKHSTKSRNAEGISIRFNGTNWRWIDKKNKGSTFMWRKEALTHKHTPKLVEHLCFWFVEKIKINLNKQWAAAWDPRWDISFNRHHVWMTILLFIIITWCRCCFQRIDSSVNLNRIMQCVRVISEEWER